MFDRSSWYNSYARYNSRSKNCVIKRFQIGSSNFRVWNYGNKRLQIDKIMFQLNTDGVLNVYSEGQTELKSLEELKDKINLYKKSYLLMLETQKQMKMMGDF